MTAEVTDAKMAVDSWLLLDVGDPGCHEARDAVDSLGRDARRDATEAAVTVRAPLSMVAAHCADDGEIARDLAELRRLVDHLDPSGLGAPRSLLSRAIGMVPGVGTPVGRYLQRVDSSRQRIVSTAASLDRASDVLTRDNATLRSDQERLRELSTRLSDGIDRAQAFVDALVFAIDVELPFGDPRRPLFEDDLLVTCRHRLSDLEQARVVNEQAVDAIESVMNTNREMIRGIDRSRELTLAALVAASSAGASGNGAGAAPDALQEVFDEIDDTLSDVEARRRAAVPMMERTLRQVTT